MPYLLKNTSEVVAALDYTSKSIKESVNQLFREMKYNISYEQWEVLQCVGSNDGTTQIEIAKSCHKEPASVSRTLSYLSKYGIIRREKDDKNKRINRIFLSLKGKDLLENASSAVDSVAKKCLEDIFDMELNLLIKILDRIRKNDHSVDQLNV